MPKSEFNAKRNEMERFLSAQGITNAGAAWTVLDGGQTNLVWRAISDQQDVVIKLFTQGTTNPLFPNNPIDEAYVLQQLDGLDIAPRLLHSIDTPVGHCLIYAHLKGMRWAKGTVGVAQMLSRLHEMSGPHDLRRAPDGSDAITRQTLRILDKCDGAGAALMQGQRPQGCIPPSGKISLLHGDPVAGNIIDHLGNLRLIDWQCPAVGDPCEDIAFFLSPAMQSIYRGAPLSDEEQHLFLSTYRDQTTIARYRRLAPWYHWRTAAYYLWQVPTRGSAAREAVRLEIEALKRAHTPA